MIPSTSDRVESATPEYLNKKIFETTINRLSKIIQSSSEKRSTLIENRLKELNNEWDMERLLEFNASTLLIITGLLAYFYSFNWLFGTLAIAGFLWQHAIQGWCPPVPILRSIFAKRTSVEILSEKVALKILRGDYQSIDPIVFEGNGKQLLELADLHCYNGNKTKLKQI